MGGRCEQNENNRKYVFFHVAQSINILISLQFYPQGNCMSKFYAYFKENMDALGLPAPDALFGTAQTAAGTAATLLGLIEKFGKKVTLGDIIGAGTRLEQLAVIGGISASFYVGAVIGSIAVATGRTLSGGTSLSDGLMNAHQNGLSAPWLALLFQQNPQLYSTKFKNRAIMPRAIA